MLWQLELVALFAIHRTKTPPAVKCENLREKRSATLSLGLGGIAALGVVGETVGILCELARCAASAGLTGVGVV
jgi:hypothetical protein